MDVIVHFTQTSQAISSQSCIGFPEPRSSIILSRCTCARYVLRQSPGHISTFTIVVVQAVVVTPRTPPSCSPFLSRVPDPTLEDLFLSHRPCLTVPYLSFLQTFSSSHCLFKSSRPQECDGTTLLDHSLLRYLFIVVQGFPLQTRL